MLQDNIDNQDAISELQEIFKKHNYSKVKITVKPATVEMTLYNCNSKIDELASYDTINKLLLTLSIGSLIYDEKSGILTYEEKEDMSNAIHYRIVRPASIFYYN